MLGLLETAIALALLLWISWTALNLFMRARIASAMMAEAVPYEALTTDFRKTLLILGDSTGVGSGATRPEESIAGRLAPLLGATYVENQAKNGAEVEDLSTQIQHLRLSRYDFILIQIGGNDILAFHSAKKTAYMLDKIMDTLPDAGKIALMCAGNVGGATLIPYIARPLYTYMTLQIHKEFARLAKKRGITYINLFIRPSKDPFMKDPARYLSEDGLHPSSEGYGIWFEQIKASLSIDETESPQLSTTEMG
jgi:lysophospholipase L1-like esterase